MLFRVLAVLLVAGALGSHPASALVYVGVLGGVNMNSDAKLGDSGPLSAAGSTLATDTGFNGAGIAGLGFGHWRIEAEVSYAYNKVGEVTNPPGAASGSGNITTLAYMGNVHYDIPIPVPIITPYVGAGVGWATVSYNDFSIPGSLSADTSDSALAWQVGAGLAFKVAPLTRIVLDYKYFATRDLSMQKGSGAPFTTDYDRHTYRLGLRIGF